MVVTRVAERLPDVVLTEDDALREAIDEIPALHFHGALFTLPRVGRPEVDLDLFGPTLADQKVIVLPNVLLDRLVHLVARDPHRLAVDDPASESTATSVVPPPMSTINAAARLLDRQPGPHRRRYRLLNEIHVAGPGVHRGVADGPPLDLRDPRGNRHHDPWSKDRAMPPMRPRDEVRPASFL